MRRFAALLGILIPLTSFAATDLTGDMSFMPVVIDPGSPLHVTAAYANLDCNPATGVVMTIDLPGVDVFRALPSMCSAEPGRVTCRVAAVPPREDFTYIEFDAVAPDDPTLRTLPVTLQITENETDADPFNNRFESDRPVYQTFYVTNMNDDGEGSLREQIEAANARCTTRDYCRIGFRIDGLRQRGAWHSIALRKPLPAITAPVLSIDGVVRTRVADNR